MQREFKIYFGYFVVYTSDGTFQNLLLYFGNLSMKCSKSKRGLRTLACLELKKNLLYRIRFIIALNSFKSLSN